MTEREREQDREERKRNWSVPVVLVNLVQLVPVSVNWSVLSANWRGVLDASGHKPLQRTRRDFN